MELIFFNLRKSFVFVLLILVIFFLSLFGYLYPGMNYAIFWLLVAAVFLLTWIKTEYGVYAVLVELFIGSKGYLFSFSLQGFVVPLRLALFLIVISVFLFKAVRGKKLEFFQSNLWPSFLILAAFLAYGLINGIIHHDLKVVFYDVNAYLYFALIFPIFHVLRRRESIFVFFKILSVSALSVALITFIILADFSLFQYSPGLVDATRIQDEQLKKMGSLSDQPENARLAQTTRITAEKLKLNWQELSPEKNYLYRWLQDTGQGQVSYLGGRLFRVFMTSHFYLVVYLIILLSFLLTRQGFKIKKNLFSLAMALILILSMIISFSRSFWLGFAAAFIFLLTGLPFRRIIKLAAFLVSLALVVMCVLYFVWPDIFGVFTNRFTSLFRPTTELAASNRMSLVNPILEKVKAKPIFGSGFGTEVTYKSLVAGTDLVEYVKVYVYEWGYLDIMVKIGILGLITYLFFIAMIIKNYFVDIKNFDERLKFLIRGLMSGLIFLLIVHFTTPYLNHPLGLGFLMICAAIFYYKKEILTYEFAEKSHH
ncbi:MAG: O-antigen ligase family protein [Patescibacteria group bacterium]